LIGDHWTFAVHISSTTLLTPPLFLLFCLRDSTTMHRYSVQIFETVITAEVE